MDRSLHRVVSLGGFVFAWLRHKPISRTLFCIIRMPYALSAWVFGRYLD
ncbi:hypothetical protein [Halomonas sp. QHL1]|nr:hypothetical protein [Halomonas sp. QHL1]